MLPDKIRRQLEQAGLPDGGDCPFRPRIRRNRRNDPIVEKRSPSKGPRRSKKGWVDEQGRIWIRDYAHAGLPDHWDVQEEDGESYFRVGMDGVIIDAPAPDAGPVPHEDADSESKDDADEE